MQHEVVALLLLGIVVVGGIASVMAFVARPVTGPGNEEDEGLPFGAAYIVMGHDGRAFVGADGYIVGVVDNKPDRRTREFDDITRFDVNDYARWAKAHGITDVRVELHTIGFWYVEAAGGLSYDPPVHEYRQAVYGTEGGT